MKKLALLILAAMTAPMGWAQIRLPEIISDGMVLQQNDKATIWGWAESGSKITIAPSWTKQKFTATADFKGYWEARIQTPAAGYEPQTIKISEGKNNVTLNDILIGEVWFCSGQSNMEMRMEGYGNCATNDALEEIATALTRKGIRMVTVPHNGSLTPLDEAPGKWQKCSPETVPGFSATGYFFAKMLNQALDVPVGIIACSWGGSKVEGWLPEEVLSTYPDVDLQAIKDNPKQYWEWHIHSPEVMYNGMYYPVRKYTVKGFVWYQGESNVGAHEVYPERFAALAKIWRENQGSEEKPIMIAEIAPYEFYEGPVSAAYFREAQHRIPEIVPNSLVMSTNDLVEKDEPYQIHPGKKREIGYRLAYGALNRAYGMSGVYCESPRFESMTVEGSTVWITMTNIPNGFTKWNGFEGFELAGEDQVFHPATASLYGYKIIVNCPEVPNPVAVRYCFKNFQVGNVKGIYGLPLIPFRSDNW